MAVPARNITLNAEMRTDPTRTTTLRKQYEAEGYKRWRKVKGLILKTVAEYDALDLAGNNPVLLVDVGPVRRFDVVRSSEKIQEYMDWMHRAVDSHVLGNAVREAGRIIEHDRWQEVYVKAAYKKGIVRSLSELGKQGIDIFKGIPPERFFNHSIHADSLGLLIERGFEELKGVSEATLQQIQRVMADGMAQGDSPRVIARALNKRVDSIGVVRSRMIARSEIVRSHSESTLNLYEQAGVEEVTAEVEFTSIDDERRCERCENLTKGLTEDGTPRERGNIYTIDEARGIIPVHPNCILDGQTRIKTIGGDKQIRHIVIGDKVLTHKGTYEPVTSVQREPGYSGLSVKIFAQRNHRIVITPDHPILTEDGWKEAGNLSSEDRLIVRGHSCPVCGEPTPFWKETCSGSCSTKAQWNDPEIREKMKQGISRASAQMWAEKGANPEWRRRILLPAHSKIKELVKKGISPLHRWWQENPEEAMHQAKHAAALGASGRSKNGMEGRTGPDHPNWKGGKDEYHRLRALADGNWWVERKKALKRDAYKCQLCGITGNHAILDVHHVVGLHDGGHNELDNLITLCRSCHIAVEWNSIDIPMIAGGEGSSCFVPVPIKKIEVYGAKQKKIRWNLSVENAESFVAAGFVVHNCRCAWLPVVAEIANNNNLTTNQKVKLVWKRRQRYAA